MRREVEAANFHFRFIDCPRLLQAVEFKFLLLPRNGKLNVGNVRLRHGVEGVARRVDDCLSRLLVGGQILLPRRRGPTQSRYTPVALLQTFGTFRKGIFDFNIPNAAIRPALLEKVSGAMQGSKPRVFVAERGKVRNIRRLRLRLAVRHYHGISVGNALDASAVVIFRVAVFR